MSYHFLASFFVAFLITSCATKQNPLVKKAFVKRSGALEISDIHEVLAQNFDGESLRDFNKKLLKTKEERLLSYWKDQLFLRGQFAYLEGKYEKSRLYYEILGELNPRNAFIQTRYGMSLIRLGNLKKAEDIFQKTYAFDKSERMGLLLGGVQMGLGKTKQAEKSYKSILAHHKNSQEACLLLSKFYSQEKKVQQAEKQLRECPDKSSHVYYELGKLALDEGELGRAQTHFKKALEERGGHSLALVGLADIYRAQKKNKKAMRIYQNYLEKHPEDYLVLNKLVAWYMSEGESHKALPLVEKLLDLDSTNQGLKIRLGVLYVECEKLDKAIYVFNEILGVNPKASRIHYYLGSIYQEKEDLEKAIFHFSKVAETSPLFEDSILQISSLLSQTPQENRGEERFFAFMAKHEKRVGVALELGVLKANFYEEKGLFLKAIKSLEPLRKHKNFQGSHLFYLISLYEKDKNFSQVDKELLGILKREPENAQALNFLGYSYLERGIHKKKSFEYISKAFKLRPNDGYIRDSLGWFYFKDRKFKKAVKLLEKAYKDSEEDPEVALHLAKAYQALGQDFQAFSLLQKTFQKTNSPAMRKVIAESLKKMENVGNRRPASLEE